MTDLDLILAHQAMLRYVHEHDLSDDLRDVLDYLNVGPRHYDPHARGILRAIVRGVGRRVNETDAHLIADYVRGN